jgi:hypothetical protein
MAIVPAHRGLGGGECFTFTPPIGLDYLGFLLAHLCFFVTSLFIPVPFWWVVPNKNHGLFLLAQSCMAWLGFATIFL